MPAAPAAALKVAPARTALTMRSWISGGSLERRPPVRRRVGVVSIVGSTVTGGWCLCRVVAYRDAPGPVRLRGGAGGGGVAACVCYVDLGAVDGVHDAPGVCFFAFEDVDEVAGGDASEGVPVGHGVSPAGSLSNTTNVQSFSAYGQGAGEVARNIFANSVT